MSAQHTPGIAFDPEKVAAARASHEAVKAIFVELAAKAAARNAERPA